MIQAAATWQGPVSNEDGSLAHGSVLRRPDSAAGLAGAGYVEEEWFLGGSAHVYGYDRSGAMEAVRESSYLTRLLVRRPADVARASGVVHLEAGHISDDRMYTWSATHPYLLRSGHCWAGLTVFPPSESLLRDKQPARYADIDIPDGVAWDVLAQVALLLRTEPALLGGVEARRLHASGWSHTGSMWRTFLGEGFHETTRLPGGRPAIDGYAIILSAGAFIVGYLPLSAGVEIPPTSDPRRTVSGHDVPVVEMMSECEAGTNRRSLRDDSDAAGDRFRLYQVAGASHFNLGPGEAPPVPLLEEPNGFPFDALARAALDNLDRWAGEGRPPPLAERLALDLDPDAAAPEGGFPGELPLRRDDHGNALGGVRTPYVDVPIARYYPHSTALARPITPPGLAHKVDLGVLIGHRQRFGRDELVALYGTPTGYAQRFAAGMDRLVEEGWLLAPEAAALTREAEAVEF